MLATIRARAAKLLTAHAIMRVPAMSSSINCSIVVTRDTKPIRSMRRTSASMACDKPGIEPVARILRHREESLRERHNLGRHLRHRHIDRRRRLSAHCAEAPCPPGARPPVHIGDDADNFAAWIPPLRHEVEVSTDSGFRSKVTAGKGLVHYRHRHTTHRIIVAKLTPCA